ncbi:Protein of unknown function [Gryllus bimaculatus]|nr:Protein of unknown function [Gryllus bimaculatus]
MATGGTGAAGHRPLRVALAPNPGRRVGAPTTCSRRCPPSPEGIARPPAAPQRPSEAPGGRPQPAGHRPRPRDIRRKWRRPIAW